MRGVLIGQASALSSLSEIRPLGSLIAVFLLFIEFTVSDVFELLLLDASDIGCVFDIGAFRADGIDLDCISLTVDCEMTVAFSFGGIVKGLIGFWSFVTIVGDALDSSVFARAVWRLASSGLLELILVTFAVVVSCNSSTMFCVLSGRIDFSSLLFESDKLVFKAKGRNRRCGMNLSIWD